MALRDPRPDLAEHGVGAAAARGAADERDHAERARERAAVLDLHERAHAVEPRVGLHATDRADVAGDCLDRLLDLTADDGDVRRAARRTRARRAGRRSRSRRRGRACEPPARRPAATSRDASFVTQHVLTTATSPAPSTSRWPSRSSRSRSACASVWETLQPRKRTEKLAIEPENLLADVQVGRPAAVLDAPLAPVAVELRVVGDEVAGRDRPRRLAAAARARAPRRRRCSRARGRIRAGRPRADRLAGRRSRRRCRRRSARVASTACGSKSNASDRARSRASPPRSRGRRSRSRRRARCPAPRLPAAPGRAASSDGRRCRRRGPDRSRRRSPRRRAPPTAGRSRASRREPACGTAASGLPSRPRRRTRRRRRTPARSAPRRRRSCRRRARARPRRRSPRSLPERARA